MADGPRRGSSNGGVSGQLKRPEDWSLNRFVLVQTYLLMAITGLGYLALTWSTVVLLGGFVTSLVKKDFWCLTVISMIQAARVFNDLAEHQFAHFVYVAMQLSLKALQLIVTQITTTPEFPREGNLFTVMVVFWRILSRLITGICFELAILPCMIALNVLALIYRRGAMICIGLSLWRIVKRDYGSIDEDKANLTPALDTFYSLILCQGVLYFIWSNMGNFEERIAISFSRDCKFPKEWGGVSAMKYLDHTKERFWKSTAFADDKKLIHYAVDLLDSESWDDNLYGVRMLDAFIRQDADVRSLLLPSRPKIQKLIDILGWRRGPECSSEIRELAARIVAHLASDIHLAQFPGALQCVTSLLQEDTIGTYWSSNQQGRLHPYCELSLREKATLLRVQMEEKRREKAEQRRQRMEERRKKRMKQRQEIKEQRQQQRNQQHQDNDNAQEQQEQEDNNAQQQQQQQQEDENGQQQHQEEVDSSSSGHSGGGGCNQLILQGLTILKKLASDDDNCRDICSAPGLLPKILAPLYSKDLIQDIDIEEWAHIVDKSFKVVRQIIRSPGETGRKLRQEITSIERAVKNLQDILGMDSKAAPKLQIRAMEILTELALDLSVSVSEEIKGNLITKQLQVFLADEGEQEPTTKLNPLKATAGKMLALLSTNSKTNSESIKKAYGDIPARLSGFPYDPKGIISHLTKLLYSKNIEYIILAVEILQNLCSHRDFCSESDKQIVKGTLLPKVLTEIPYREPPEIKPSEQQNKIRQPVPRWPIFKKKKSEGSQKKSAHIIDEENPQIPAAENNETNHNISSQGNSVQTQEISSAAEHNKSSDCGQEEQICTKKLQEALLSLILVICKTVISAADFDYPFREQIISYEEFVKKLKAIVQENCQATAESLRIVKLCGRISESLMEPKHKDYTDLFKKHDFVKSLSEASKIMSNLESCMLFTGTDLGMKKTVRPLLSDIVKHAQQLSG